MTAGIDRRRVRVAFIRLLRRRTPDHPFVRQHDAWVREAVERGCQQCGAPINDHSTLCAACQEERYGGDTDA